MPGRLFELRTAEPRAALAIIEGPPVVLAAHLYGDIVRVVLDVDDAAQAETVLEQAGVSGAVRAAEVDMEIAFAVLAELNRAEPDRERVAG